MGGTRTRASWPTRYGCVSSRSGPSVLHGCAHRLRRHIPHQHPLRPRAAIAAVALHHFAPDHRRPDLALPVVVGRGDFRMALKREDLVPVFFQPPGQAARIRVGVGRQRQIQQAFVQLLDARRIALRREIRAFAQAQGVPEQPPRFPGERLPLHGGIVLVHLDQFIEQVKQATLMLPAEDGVVGRPEIGDQDAFERFVEDSFQGRAAAATVQGGGGGQWWKQGVIHLGFHGVLATGAIAKRCVPPAPVYGRRMSFSSSVSVSGALALRTRIALARSLISILRARGREMAGDCRRS